MFLRRWIDPAELPDEMAISAITLAELSAGLHEVRSNDEQDAYDERAERARRLEVLQRAESEFDPVPFDAEAARIFGSVTAAVIAAGRKPRGRVVDLMIAATAIAEGCRCIRLIPLTSPVWTASPASSRSPGHPSRKPAEDGSDDEEVQVTAERCQRFTGDPAGPR